MIGVEQIGQKEGRPFSLLWKNIKFLIGECSFGVQKYFFIQPLHLDS